MTSTGTKKVRVIDRNNMLLIEYNNGLPANMTVEELKKELVKTCDKISKFTHKLIMMMCRKEGYWHQQDLVNNW